LTAIAPALERELWPRVVIYLAIKYNFFIYRIFWDNMKAIVEVVVTTVLVGDMVALFKAVSTPDSCAIGSLCNPSFASVCRSHILRSHLGGSFRVNWCCYAAANAQDKE